MSVSFTDSDGRRGFLASVNGLGASAFVIFDNSAPVPAFVRLMDGRNLALAGFLGKPRHQLNGQGRPLAGAQVSAVQVLAQHETPSCPFRALKLDIRTLDPKLGARPFSVPAVQQLAAKHDDRLLLPVR